MHAAEHWSLSFSGKVGSHQAMSTASETPESDSGGSLPSRRLAIWRQEECCEVKPQFRD
jgi:hypothetical protein